MTINEKFLEGLCSRFELTEERTSELKEISINTVYSRNTRKNNEEK